MKAMAAERAETFAALDGLRGMAFLWVFLGHLPRTEHSQWIGRLQLTNWVGVHIFFVLSAFLITYLALIEREKTGSFSVKNFLARRALRLLPLYFLTLLFGFFIFPYWGVGIGPVFSDEGYGDFLSSLPFYLTFSVLLKDLLSLNVGGGSSLIGPLWSIIVEVQFYFVFVFIFRFFNLKSIVLKFILYFTISTFFKIWIFQHFGASVVYAHMFSAMDSFVAGVILALLYRQSDWLKNRIVQINESWKYQVSLFLAIFILYRWIAKTPHPVNATQWTDVVLVYGLAMLLASFFLIAVLCLVSGQGHAGIELKPFKLFRRVLEGKITVSLGRVSYGLYVFHSTVIYFLADFLLKNLPSGKVSYSLMIFTILTVSFAVATLSYKYFELPFLRLASKFRF